MGWEIQITPGGRGRRAEVAILSEGVVVLTDACNLLSIEGRQEAAARLAPAIGAKLNITVSAEHVEAKLETAWNAFVSEKLRQDAAPPAPDGPDRAELLAGMPEPARVEADALLNNP